MRSRMRSFVGCTLALAMLACSTGDEPSRPAADKFEGVVTPMFTANGLGTIGDLVWNDANANGLQDPGEEGMPGLTVYLITCAHDILQSTVTDANGNYLFENLEPGGYCLGFTMPPSGFIATHKDVGSDDTIDSDCGDDGKTTVCIQLDGQTDLTWDCGLCPKDGEEPTGCRVTGGGVNESGEWSGDFDQGRCAATGDRYTFGGQAGANTALPPQPAGEWQHNQHNGPSGRWSFHGGTRSAPDGTAINEIVCSDPGFCDPARPAPAKQIDFFGVGRFSNMHSAPPHIADHVEVGVSLHAFSVNIDDAGEPGRRRGNINFCPEFGFGLNGAPVTVDCDCPDFYRIQIHEGPTDASPVMYEVYGYPKGGNLQIHPLTGFDSN